MSTNSTSIVSDFWDFDDKITEKSEEGKDTKQLLQPPNLIWAAKKDGLKSGQPSRRHHHYNHAGKRVYHVKTVSHTGSATSNHAASGSSSQQRVRVVTTPRHFHPMHKQSHLGEIRQKIKTVFVNEHHRKAQSKTTLSARVDNGSPPAFDNRFPSPSVKEKDTSFDSKASSSSSSSFSSSGSSGSSQSQEVDMLKAMKILGPTHTRLLLAIHIEQQMKKELSMQIELEKSASRIRRHGVLRSSSLSANSATASPRVTRTSRSNTPVGEKSASSSKLPTSESFPSSNFAVVLSCSSPLAKSPLGNRSKSDAQDSLNDGLFSKSILASQATLAPKSPTTISKSWTDNLKMAKRDALLEMESKSTSPLKRLSQWIRKLKI